MNWKEIEDDDDGVFFHRLHTYFCELDVMEVAGSSNGRYYAEAVFCNYEAEIGFAETLDQAKQLCLSWLLGRIMDTLTAAGAGGSWLIRGADRAVLVYDMGGPTPPVSFHLSPPHELVLLARFPSGDGQPPGITHCGGSS